ncbi:nuclear transport factor 2 family protein [Nocardioides baculatus]|uniref:Nuclear transport factor 2 family protein n=1 Tax=Nocardioides baculatus TaxID=2801337 RepID=A0ABS1LDR7_9ACTN|nr:nuclear transport factor 2 family protein [Nocardioides baculatus]MBL0749838.1 nuclear transport factor 2 family protein [Nocardioides baculatus]
MTTSTEIQPTDLPATIRAYLAAHTAREADVAIRTFTPDAVVLDDGHAFRGTAEVLDFLENAGSEYTYTSTLVGGERVDDAHWVAVIHIEGDFPGGVADLRYAFTLADDLISELVIAP